MVSLDGSSKFLNFIVLFKGLGYWSWYGIYKSRLVQPSKIVIIHLEELIESIASNLHPIINNRIIIMDPLLKRRKKII